MRRHIGGLEDFLVILEWSLVHMTPHQLTAPTLYVTQQLATLQKDRSREDCVSILQGSVNLHELPQLVHATRDLLLQTDPQLEPVSQFLGAFVDILEPAAADASTASINADLKRLRAAVLEVKTRLPNNLTGLPEESDQARKIRVDLGSILDNMLTKGKGSRLDDLPGDVSRRLTFLLATFDMPMPQFRPTKELRSSGTLTPYFSEDVILAITKIYERTEQGVSTLEFLKSIYSREWANFLDRFARQLM